MVVIMNKLFDRITLLIALAFSAFVTIGQFFWPVASVVYHMLYEGTITVAIVVIVIYCAIKSFRNKKSDVE